MCGMFGWFVESNKVTVKERAIMAAIMAVEMDRRGGDSWGYAGINTKHIHRKRGMGDMAEGLDASTLAGLSRLIGHTRAASTGRVCKRNAHPFHIGTMIGAHNGVILNHNELNVNHARDCAVDSQHIFRHLIEGKPLSELVGWGAIEWFDTRDPGSLYLGTFTGALSVYCIGTESNTKGVVWASTEAAVVRAMTMAGLSGQAYKLEDRKVYRVDSHGLYKTNQDLPVRSHKEAKDTVDLWRRTMDGA